MKAYNFENNLGSRKGKMVTFGFHVVIIGFLIFPFLLKQEIIEEEFTTVMLNFASGSASEGDKAVIVEKTLEKKPEKVVEKTVIPIEAPKSNRKPVVTSEDPETVNIPEVKEVTGETNEVKETVIPLENRTDRGEETGNGMGDKGTGEADKGKAAPGVGDGAFEGIGNLERKIIHRPNLKQLASREGIVSFIVCVNRTGVVTNVVFDPVFTTITDKKIINEALNLAGEFRFENKYSGPATECGRLQVKITHAF